MSRIGKMPIIIPEGVSVKIEAGKIVVTGPKGELTQTFSDRVEIKVSEGQIICLAKSGQNNLWGLTRTLISNAVTGVFKTWNKTLELSGVGYRAAVEGNELILTVGFSHPVRFKAPDGITFTVAENKIQISGPDKQLVGEVAAQIRKIRPPEPYKGKGIKYLGEKIRRKVGKVAKTVGVGGKS